MKFVVEYFEYLSNRVSVAGESCRRDDTDGFDSTSSPSFIKQNVLRMDREKLRYYNMQSSTPKNHQLKISDKPDHGATPLRHQ